MQIIFQDPFQSLNPRMTVYDIAAEPLVVNKLAKTDEEKMARVIKALEEVELYSAAMTTTLVPFIRASVNQWASGILVVIQFIPQQTTISARSTFTRSQSTVC